METSSPTFSAACAPASTAAWTTSQSPSILTAMRFGPIRSADAISTFAARVAAAVALIAPLSPVVSISPRAERGITSELIKHTAGAQPQIDGSMIKNAARTPLEYGRPRTKKKRTHQALIQRPGVRMTKPSISNRCATPFEGLIQCYKCLNSSNFESAFVPVTSRGINSTRIYVRGYSQKKAASGCQAATYRNQGMCVSFVRPDENPASPILIRC